MKISMMSYTIARGLRKGEVFDVEGLCRLTRELGLEAIDWVTTYGHEPREVRRITDDHGLRNICYTFFCDLNFPTPAGRATGRDEFKSGVETARTLGAHIVMLPVRGKKELSREQSFRNVIAGLKEVMDCAESAGVTVTVEHFPSPLSPFVVSADVNCAVAEIPRLRVTFDNGNVTTGGESAPEGFLNSAEYIVHAHFKDFAVCSPAQPGARLCLDGKYRRPVLLGDGDVDQIGCLRVMEESGYRGHIDFEYEGSEYTPRQATVEGVRRLREMMASLSGGAG